MYINRLNHVHYSENYIHRLMRKMRIKSRIRKRHTLYVKTKPEQVGANVLHRDFHSDYPNQKWLNDITEFKIVGQRQKLYLSAIFDTFDRSIVAYKIGEHNNNKLVLETFDEALKQNPGAHPIFHSDRGFQYTSKIFKLKLNQAGMVQSMSRVGKCIDNGPMEAFWGSLKAEMYYLNRFYSSKELIASIERYIFFYNNERLQKNLKSMTPNEMRYHAYCPVLNL